jgi:hypothetical protein
MFKLKRPSAPVARKPARHGLHHEPRNKIGVTQDCADRATDEIIEVIDNLTVALQNAVLAFMYYRLAKGAEPLQAAQKLGSVKVGLYRALGLLGRIA